MSDAREMLDAAFGEPMFGGVGSCEVAKLRSWGTGMSWVLWKRSRSNWVCSRGV